MKLANATALSLQKLINEENPVSVDIETIDSVELAAFLRFGVGNCKIKVNNLFHYLDVSDMLVGVQKNEKILLKTPDDEIIREMFENFVTLV